MIKPAIALLAFAALASGCQKATKPVPPATVVITGCQYFPRLTASAKDTDRTKEAIIGYVVTWDRVCGKKP